MAKFSKQDYVSIARVIDTTWSKLLAEAAIPTHPNYDALTAVWRVRVDMTAVVTAFVDMFAADNPNFDRERFVLACEGECD